MLYYVVSVDFGKFQSLWNILFFKPHTFKITIGGLENFEVHHETKKQTCETRRKFSTDLLGRKLEQIAPKEDQRQTDENFSSKSDATLCSQFFTAPAKLSSARWSSDEFEFSRKYSAQRNHHTAVN